MKFSAVMRGRLAGAALAAFVLPAVAASPASPQFGQWGIDLAAMDRSVKPGDDFFRFVNGAWYAKAVIPPDQTRTGTFHDLGNASDERLRDILVALAAKPDAELSSEEKKLRDLYDAFLDRKAIDAAGLAPARKHLDLIAGLKTPEDVADATGRPGIGLTGPFDVGIGVDRKDPGRYVVSVHQSGLAMARSNYVLDDKALAKIRLAYVAHLANMFRLAGIGDGERRAAAIYALEQRLAQAHWSNVENRNATKTYNPMTLKELTASAPQFPWIRFFQAAGVPLAGAKGDRRVIVAQPDAFAKLAAIFAATPVAVWRDYLTVHYLDAHAALLPAPFEEERFAFYGVVLSGQDRQQPRTIRAVHLLDGTMGEALGKLYVARYFPPDAEAKAMALVNNLLATYDADIRTLPWMTPATRAKALDKLHRMSIKIGYPARWRDYSGLVIDRHDLLGNRTRANEFEVRREIARLDEPVDRIEWNYTPQTVNAGYNPSRNEISFPAAILQPPFFDPRADDAVNYGAIGRVIGHEISHAFDDQGSKYDGTGALKNWWTRDDRVAFEAKARALGAQYDAYEPLPGFRVNGALTTGENIADNAGTAVALKAYHLSLGGKPAPVLDGWTGDQRFFLSLAQVNRDKRRPDALRQQLLTDVHAPSAQRAIGVVRNQDEWYAAFGVKPGETYYLPPERRVHIW